MTAVLLFAGIAVALVAVGHCILGMTFRLPFTGWQRITYWALVAIATFFFVSAWLSHQVGLAGVVA